jgi:hypothetical protein
MMLDIPRLALSVRQPWAWAIVHAGKDIENRSWRRPNPALNYRGDFAVHAAKGMTRDEYEDAADFMADLGITVPPAAELQRAGIVGVSTLADIVRDSESRWYMGGCGLQLANTRPVPFIPSVGELGFFAWKPASASIVPAPARWMQAKPALPATQGDLLEASK